MKELKNYTQEITNIADQNVEGFNHTFLFFKTTFKILYKLSAFFIRFFEPFQ